MAGTGIGPKLLPEPRELTRRLGVFQIEEKSIRLRMPSGPEYAAAREAAREALRLAGAASISPSVATDGLLQIGEGAPLPSLPTEGIASEGYVLAIGKQGVSARGATPAALMYAAQTLLQICRTSAGERAIPCCTVRDSPEFAVRGIYIEGGQERFGRIVQPDYLRAQIRRLASLKMNTLVVEAYNLFPFASFPQCADAGSLTEAQCREVFAEAKRCHVTLMPSIQTLAQAYELVWANEAGKPYREATAPGLICPSEPSVYPFIKGLYRDLLKRFDEAPLIGIGCSEIDMQWQSRYCPKCKARIDAGETVRDLLLGHAEKCIKAVEEVAAELHRPVRPLIWGDEFYMYGPGHDWVGIDRIPKSVVMGFWKYWPDYAGIGGLMERGYDVLGVSAMYNHCFYLANLTPEFPKKSWPSMEQTGLVNIAGLVQGAAAARKAHPDARFLGAAAASFSKHRLRAFDSIWIGFALNAQALWSKPERPLDEYRDDFLTTAVRHLHDARTDLATLALADAYTRLNACKSLLEMANQTIHDVVGVVDTQEAGYIGNTVRGAWRRCGELLGADGKAGPELQHIRRQASLTVHEVRAILPILDAQRPYVGDQAELANLRLAAEKISLHAQRQVLMIVSREVLARIGDVRSRRDETDLAMMARRWTNHAEQLEGIRARSASLSTQGDPTGLGSVAADVAAIADHLGYLARRGPRDSRRSRGATVIQEAFTNLDPTVWEALGEPELRDGGLETHAPGGWGKLSGLLTKQTFTLNAHRQLTVEFDITPRRLGVDSQLFAAADKPTDISFKFAMACSGGRFSAHTQSSKPLNGAWTNPDAGWKQRSVSPEVKVGQRYHVHAEIRRNTWRVAVRADGDSPWDMPFWDTGVVPMDAVTSTRLVFADVEPEGSAGATRWEAIKVIAP
ncbi:MAG: family 20 glycosylhydrolase [Armatimonadetes bacterium]|nr:family 20 glycosylhydrolase [Armatimonadota bacterium]